MKKEHLALLKWGIVFSPFIIGFIIALFLPFIIPNKEKPVVPKTISEAQAISIAEGKFVEMYGQQVFKQRPWITERKENQWVIEGTFHCPIKKVCKGGVAIAEISATDGSIIKIFHGK